MTSFQWKILGIEQVEGVITSAHYQVTAKGYEQTVKTEGNWKFANPVAHIPYENVRETDIISWIEQSSENAINNNLENQLLALNQEQSVLPWLKNTFTPFKD